MKSPLIIRLALLLCLSGLCGCATITHGTTQSVPIASDPVGAKIMVDDKPMGVTPAEVKLSRKTGHVVNLNLEGYESERVNLEARAGGAVVGNLLVGGIIGMAVDGSNGAQNNLYPESINVKLRPAGSPLSPAPASPGNPASTTPNPAPAGPAPAP